MRFSLQREVFLKPLAQVVNVVERRQTLPVLANLLVQVKDGQLSLTGTDLEVEMVARHGVDDAQDGETTIPARKLFEIVRALPDGSKVTVSQTGDKVTVQAGRSRFTLASLAGQRFPLGRRGGGDRTGPGARGGAEGTDRAHRLRDGPAGRALLPQRPAVRPARQVLRCVATDGHRLALCEAPLEDAAADQAPDHRAAQGRAGTAAPAGRRRPRRWNWKSAAATSGSSATM